MLPSKQILNTRTDADKVPALQESTVGAPAEKAPTKVDPTKSTPAQNGSVNSTSNSNKAADRHVVGLAHHVCYSNRLYFKLHTCMMAGRCEI